MTMLGDGIPGFYSARRPGLIRLFEAPFTSRLLKKGPWRGCERRGLDCKTPRPGVSGRIV
jgi:hypothetical protein